MMACVCFIPTGILSENTVSASALLKQPNGENRLGIVFIHAVKNSLIDPKATEVEFALCTNNRLLAASP